MFQPDSYLAGACLRVLNDVGESFQRNTIGGYFDGGRQERHGLGHIECDLQAIRARVVRNMLTNGGDQAKFVQNRPLYVSVFPYRAGVEKHL